MTSGYTSKNYFDPVTLINFSYAKGIYVPKMVRKCPLMWEIFKGDNDAVAAGGGDGETQPPP